MTSLSILVMMSIIGQGYPKMTKQDSDLVKLNSEYTKEKQLIFADHLTCFYQWEAERSTQMILNSEINVSNIGSNLLDGITSGHSQTPSTQTCSSLHTVFPHSVLSGHGEFTLEEPSLQIQMYTVSVASRQVPGPQSTPSQAVNIDNNMFVVSDVLNLTKWIEGF